MTQDLILGYCHFVKAKCIEQCSMETCRDKDIIDYRYYRICKHMITNCSECGTKTNELREYIKPEFEGQGYEATEEDLLYLCPSCAKEVDDAHERAWKMGLD